MSTENENVKKFVNKLLEIENETQASEKIKESAFDFFGENYRLKLTEKILQKLRIVDTISLISSILSCIFAVVALESNVEFKDQPKNTPLGWEKDGISAYLVFSPDLPRVQALRMINTIFTLIIVVCIILHYIIRFKYDKFRLVIPKNYTIFNFNYLFYMILEVILNLIHTPLGLDGSINIRQRTKASGDVEINYDVLLTILQLLFRSYHLLKYYSFHSKWNNIYNEKICDKANVKFNFYFCFKCEFKESPFFLVMVLLIESIIVFGYSLRCSEMFFMTYTGIGEFNMDWRQVWNGFWCIIITMMTVGFGDFYPISILGRLIAVIATFWGTFLVSMMVAALTYVVEFNSQEATAYHNIKSAISEKQYGLNAVILIQNCYRYILQVRKLHDDVTLINDPYFRKKKSLKFREMKKAFNDFRNIRAIKEKQSYYSELEKVMKKLNLNISNEIEKIKMQINVMPEIKYLLKDYQQGQDKLKVKIIELYKELEELNIFKNLFVK